MKLNMLGGLAGVMLIAAVAAAVENGRLEYPQTRRVDQVDVIHGVKVADPYRWLEADVRTSPEVAAWVAAENKVTNAYLDAIPQREAIRRRLAELWNYAAILRPDEKSGPILLLQKRRAAKPGRPLRDPIRSTAQPRVLLDPNTWSKDGTVALAGLGIQRGRPLRRLRPQRGRLRLVHLARAGDRHGQGSCPTS